MYLKSLTLKGFKSFANKSTMQFEPGLTVVVGPNGSGKSNISDAILWVLGEQSARQLRGQAMEDVIFAGSSVRAAVGVAEVTLVLDNSDHTLAVDYTEVALTRRMYRSGESEYLINGSPARLRDIQDILHDSGLGKDAHSIIGQGKLEQVLTSKPEERRFLIEEAAGISKHRRRKERSLKKLSQMDASLLRARDLERSLMRQLRPLERQVDKAARYKELHARVLELQTQLAVDDLRQLKQQFDQLQQEHEQMETLCEVSRLKERQRKDELAQLEALLEEKGLCAGDLTAQRQKFHSVNDRISTLVRLAQQKQQHALSRAQALEVQEENAHRHQTDDSIALEQVRSDLAGVQGQMRLIEQRLGQARDRARDARNQRIELDRLCGAQGAAVKEARAQADSCELNISRAQGALRNLEVQEGLFATRIERLQQEIALRLEEMNACAQQIETETSQKQHLDEECAQAEQTLTQLQMKKDQTDEQLANLSREHTHIQSELQALQTLIHTFEQERSSGYALAHHDAYRASLHATVARYVRAPQEYERLVEVMCGEYLGDYIAQHQCLDSLVSAALNLDESATIRLYSDASCLHQSHPQIDGCIHLMSQLDIDTPAKPALEMMLGSVYVVPSSSAALRLASEHPSCTFVTSDGRVRVSHAMTEIYSVHPSDDDQQSQGVLARQRRLLQLEAAVTEMSERLEDAQNQARMATEAYTNAQELHRQCVRAVQEVQQRLTLAHREYDRLRAAHTHSEAELAQVSKSAQELVNQSDEAKAALVSLQADFDTYTLAHKQAEEQLAALYAERDEARREERTQQDQLNADQLELATVSERAKHLKDRVSALEQNVERLQRLCKSTQGELAIQRLVSGRVDPLIMLLLQLETAAEFWLERVSTQVALEQEGSDALKKSIKDARDGLEQAQEHTQALVAQQSNLDIEKGKLEVQVEQAVAAIHETGAILEEALQLDPLEDRHGVEVELARVERQVSELGPINHVAMHQYDELKEQHAYIAQQTADLDHARKAIQKIIAAIDRKMKDQFLHTFAQVDANFREIFATLFDGGRAHLQLTDPDHPHETGVEVVAQPRGKRLTKMTLLSGGEKSLTAISLLFALYKTRTVPFYVLDEIEAALDDANLERLLKALDEFRTKTQLIVVSHQRKTMERADVLYGVSMHADGISQVVSQKLKDLPASAYAPSN